jgi:hypothetical protein
MIALTRYGYFTFVLSENVRWLFVVFSFFCREFLRHLQATGVSVVIPSRLAERNTVFYDTDK